MVSVCIATYNGARYIREQLESILPQLSGDDEIIISDDSSTDSTIEVIRSLADDRITILPCQTFRNPIFNFENSIRHSNGDIIFLADQDDIWDPRKIEIMTPLIKKHDLALCDCSLIDEEGTLLHPSYFALIGSQPGLLRNLYKTNPYMGCCMGFSRKLLEVVLPFPRRVPMHDLWIGLMGELLFNPIFVPEKLVLYRRHQTNVSPTGMKSTNSIFCKIGIRMNTILPALRRTLKIKSKLWKA